jgi:hypothetical protein
MSRAFDVRRSAVAVETLQGLVTLPSLGRVAQSRPVSFRADRPDHLDVNSVNFLSYVGHEHPRRPRSCEAGRTN